MSEAQHHRGASEGSPREAETLKEEPSSSWFARRRRAARAFLRRNRAPLQVSFLFFLLIFAYAIPDLMFSVYPGESGVLWRRFGGGTETDWVYGEGFHLKLPWDKVYIYDIRLQEHTQIVDVLTSDGLAIDVETSVRFRLHQQGLGLLHRHLGPNYVQTLLVPEIGSLVREHISQYDPEQLYTEQRARIEEEVSRQVVQEIKVRYESEEGIYQALHVEDILFRSISLPPELASFIEQKLIRKQQVFEFDYKLEIERKERERKEIEAEGIRLFQDIVSEGISEQYLKWKGIDATLELARSDNSKVVVIGAGEDGLPIILGGLDYPAATTGAPASTAPAPANPPNPPNP